MPTDIEKSLWIEMHGPFIEGSRQRLPEGLRSSVARCVSGLNRGDKGSLHRLFCITQLTGMILPQGVVVAEPSSVDRPTNTTWLSVPTAKGVRFSTVNCVRRVSEGVYKLARSNASDLALFKPSNPLFEDLDTVNHHLMVAIQWTHSRKDESMKFVVRLLDGVFDMKRRLFLAEFDEDLISYSSAQDELRVFETAEPTGPLLILKPKSVKNENAGQ